MLFAEVFYLGVELFSFGVGEKSQLGQELFFGALEDYEVFFEAFELEGFGREVFDEG